ncbi:hypothetical protein ES703_12780 [subsurface metagenome]
MGELAVVGVFSHPEIDAAAGGIGKTLVNQALYYFNDFWYLLGSLGVDVSSLDVEGVHILEVAIGVFLGKLGGGNTALVGAVYNLVVDVGDVLHILDLIAPEAQVTPDDVKDDVAHAVADMSIVVGGNTADVYLDLVLYW